MTTNYTNIMLYCVEQDDVLAWCEDNDVTAYVSPTIEDVTVLYENTLQEHLHLEKPLEILLARASKISADMMCPAMVTVVADDDMFMYVLFLDGEMIDNYMSYVNKKPANGKPDVLIEIYDAEDEIDRVKAALYRESISSAAERHMELMDALVLPPMMIEMGFEFVDEGEKPHGIEDFNDIRYVGPDED